MLLVVGLVETVALGLEDGIPKGKSQTPKDGIPEKRDTVPLSNLEEEGPISLVFIVIPTVPTISAPTTISALLPLVPN